MPTSETQPPTPLAAFQGSLLDPRGQPHLVVGGSGENTLIWTLANGSTTEGADLLVTPFEGGEVGPARHHFAFAFRPGALTAAPAVEGWDVAVERDPANVITTVYLALRGETPLSIPPGGSVRARWTYTDAVQENAGAPQLTVTLRAGERVTTGSAKLAGKLFGPSRLTLVPADAPSFPLAPISLDFVGRRTVLNDGQSPNTLTFAITNLADAPLRLSRPAAFTAWFDAAPNDPDQPYPWALAQVQQLASAAVSLAPPSAQWRVDRVAGGPRHLLPGNPLWAIAPAEGVTLDPQSPVLFTFRGIVTDLEPGITRMYLRFQGLPGHADGILMAELEKTPLSYGAARGEGVYLSAGLAATPPPPPDPASALHVRQHGAGPAATFSGGAGVRVSGVQGPAARLEGALEVSAGGATIRGETTLDGDTTVNGVSTVHGESRVYGAATVRGATLVEGDTTVAGPATVVGPLTVKGQATVSDLATVKGTLVVDGSSVLNGTVLVTGGSDRPALSVAQQGKGPALSVVGPAKMNYLDVSQRLSLPEHMELRLGEWTIWSDGRQLWFKYGTFSTMLTPGGWFTP